LPDAVPIEHEASHPALQHHFENMEQQREAGALGMWVFLVTEIMFFGGLFMAYLLYRYWYPEAWAAGSNHLNVVMGGLNTAVLICSSLTMALAVRSAQISAPARTQVAWIAATMVLGAAFLGVKAIEYTDKFTHHLVPGPNFRWEGKHPAPAEIFYSLYFCMTGLHAIHMIIGIGVLLFGVPILGNLFALAALSTLFIATNLSIGYTFSTIAQNQLQAMQMSIMFFLPNILLSGFMFPFAGMPTWARWVGEALPLTHYLRVVRSIMLKGSSIADLHYDAAAMFVLMLVAMTIAVTRFRRTLD